MYPIRSFNSIVGTLALSSIFQVALSQSPPQFSPPVLAPLSVTFGTTVIKPAGITIPILVPVDTPTLTLSHPNTTYIAIMLDLTVAGILPTGNTTLIHWIQPGFSSHPQTTYSSLTTASTAIVPYLPPGPPPGQTHTYSVFLYAQPAEFTISADYTAFFANITASVNNRIGINISKFEVETGIGEPVAANFFLVGSPAEASSTSSALISKTTAILGWNDATGIPTRVGNNTVQFTGGASGRATGVLHFGTRVLTAIACVLWW